jgi:hypothetical protein
VFLGKKIKKRVEENRIEKKKTVEKWPQKSNQGVP